MRSIRSLDALALHVPHKIMRLFDVLKQYHPSRKPDDDKLCGIIFVDQRMVAFVMKVCVVLCIIVGRRKFLANFEY